MDSTDESFTISSKETLLEKNQLLSPPKPKHTRNHKPKIIFFSLLILVLILVSSAMILSSICKKKKSKPFHAYLSSSSRYYCHLTMYPKLCYDPMSSIIRSTCLKSNPGLIFSGSLRVAINELNNITISINKALSSTTNNSLGESRLSKCRTWVHDSLSRLNDSLGMSGINSDVESLTYVELDNMKAWTMAATTNAFKCFRTLEEVDHVMVDGEEKMRVDEVKWGVEKARKYMVNSIGLLNSRESILAHFYSPFLESEPYDYDYVGYYYVDYRFLVFLYSVMYLFLGSLFLSSD